MQESTIVIQVVDDDPLVLTIICAVLKSAGYCVQGSESGQEALEFAKGHYGTVDLLITDYHMPKMNGIELLREMCKLYPSLKSLVISGKGSPSIAECELKPAFLPKPFLPRELMAKVKEILGLESK